MGQGKGGSDTKLFRMKKMFVKITLVAVVAVMAVFAMGSPIAIGCMMMPIAAASIVIPSIPCIQVDIALNKQEERAVREALWVLPEQEYQNLRLFVSIHDNNQEAVTEAVEQGADLSREAFPKAMGISYISDSEADWNWGGWSLKAVGESIEDTIAYHQTAVPAMDAIDYATQWGRDKIAQNLIHMRDGYVDNNDRYICVSENTSNKLYTEACAKKNFAAVEQLLQQGESPNDFRIIHRLISQGDIEMLKLFIDYGASIARSEEESQDADYSVAAAQCASARMLRFVIENGGDINAQGKGNIRGKFLEKLSGTPLHLAVQSGWRENVDYLLSAGADASVENSEGKTAYQMARENEAEAIVQIFEKYGIYA